MTASGLAVRTDRGGCDRHSLRRPTAGSLSLLGSTPRLAVAPPSRTARLAVARCGEAQLAGPRMDGDRLMRSGSFWEGPPLYLSRDARSWPMPLPRFPTLPFGRRSGGPSTAGSCRSSAPLGDLVGSSPRRRTAVSADPLQSASRPTQFHLIGTARVPLFATVPLRLMNSLVSPHSGHCQRIVASLVLRICH